VDEEQLMPYDWSKAEGERMVLAAGRRGLDAVIVNPTAIIGPYDFNLSEMGRFFLSLYHRRVPALIAGGFDFVDVRDVVEGAIAAEEKGGRGERYLFSGQWLSVRDLSLLVEECTGRSVPRFTAPMWLARLGVPFASLYSRIAGVKPLFTSGSLYTLRNHHYISHEKARRELGYNPRPVREAVRDAFDWYENHSDYLKMYTTEEQDAVKDYPD
jgi:dihydroflavonol-4-reductase